MATNRREESQKKMFRAGHCFFVSFRASLWLPSCWRLTRYFFSGWLVGRKRKKKWAHWVDPTVPACGSPRHSSPTWAKRKAEGHRFRSSLPNRAAWCGCQNWFRRSGRRGTEARQAARPAGEFREPSSSPSGRRARFQPPPLGHFKLPVQCSR